MTTPKSTEQIMAEFLHHRDKIIAVYGTAITVEEKWLREALASYLLWASEQMLEKEPLHDEDNCINKQNEPPLSFINY